MLIAKLGRLWLAKSSPSWWLAVPVGILVAMQSLPQLTRQALDGNWDSAAMAANSALLLCAPFAAGTAAWDVGRLRRARVLSGAVRRPRLVIVGEACLPAFCVGILMLVVSWLFAAISLATVPPARIALAAIVGPAVVAGWAAIGALVGLLAPRYLAAPVVVLMGYAWFAFPQALEPLWLRHLSGFEWGCCTPEVELAPAAMMAPVLMAVATVIAAAICLSAMRPGRHEVGLAVGVMLAGVACSVGLVYPFGANPVESRSDDTTCQSQGRLTACVWPEHGQMLPTVLDQAALVRSKLGSVLALPDRTSESAKDGTTWIFGVSGESSVQDIERSLVDALVPYPNEYCGRTNPEEFDRYDEAVSLLHATAGIGPADGEDGGAAMAAVVRTTERLAKTEQQGWLEARIGGIRRCNDSAPQP